jgi:hypothetical protein
MATVPTKAARIEAEYVPRRYVGSVAGRPLYGNAYPSSRATLYDCPVTVLVLEPASSAVPATTADKQYHDDNDQKGCGVHIVLPIGQKMRGLAALNGMKHDNRERTAGRLPKDAEPRAARQGLPPSRSSPQP